MLPETKNSDISSLRFRIIDMPNILSLDSKFLDALVQLP